MQASVDLVLAITKSTLKSRYRKTFAGFIWVILSPIIAFSVQALIFKNVLKISTSNYYLFLLTGIMPWIFITSTLIMTVNTFINNRSVIMAFNIDPWIYVIAQTFDNLINFIISLIFLLIIIGDIHLLDGSRVPAFLIMILVLLITVLFLSMLIAIINVYLRDVQFVLGFVINLAYFITPIFYPKELIPVNYHWVIDYNPFYILIKPFRDIFINFEDGMFLHDLKVSIILMITIIITTVVLWRRKRDDIYFNL